MKFGCSNCFFLNTTNLICQSSDISKCFSGSLRFRDNESGLYLVYIASSVFQMLLRTIKKKTWIWMFYLFPNKITTRSHNLFLWRPGILMNAVSILSSYIIHRTGTDMLKKVYIVDNAFAGKMKPMLCFFYSQARKLK